MEQRISRRIIASVMCISLVLTFVPAFVLLQVQSVFAATVTKAGPAICNVYTEGYYDEEDEYWNDARYEGCIIPSGIDRGDVKKITFVNTNTVPDNAEYSCDASEAKDGSVMCWAIKASKDDGYTLNDLYYSDKEGTYNLYYGADGVYPSLPSNSSYLFVGLYNLAGIDNLENANTSNVTNMRGMFAACYDLRTVELKNFDTSNVIDMSYMFRYSGLSSLNFSGFDTSKVEDMSYMFSDCSYLKKLDL